jgi:type II secretory pathway component PulF
LRLAVLLPKTPSRKRLVERCIVVEERRINVGFTSTPPRVEPDEDHPPPLPPAGMRRGPGAGCAVTALAVLVLLLGAGGVVAAGGWLPGFVALFLLILFYGWMFGAFVHYRRGRQDELLQVLTTALESGAPLVPALRAYLRDRPQGMAREFWVGTFLWFVLPGYYWFWHRRHSFDRKVGDVAYLLAQGATVPEALGSVRGVASRETILAAAIGQTTGQMAQAFRRVQRKDGANLWAEMIPRLFYPLLLLIFLSGIMTFWMIYLLPKLERIYKDMSRALPDPRLPDLTTAVARWWPIASASAWGLVMLLATVAILVSTNSTVRWTLPVVGRFYRLNVQGRLLQMLGILLEVGKPAPEALTLLTESGYFAPEVQSRLGEARQGVERGEPLAQSLRQQGLLPAAMVSLVQSAQRLRNLPAILEELGDSLVRRAVRIVSLASMVLTPVTALVFGVAVVLLALCMFLPLIKLIEGLSQ